MSIRFPKKNIAQQQAEKRLKAKNEPKPESIIEAPDVVRSRESLGDSEWGLSPLGSNANHLYPGNLHRLHEDIEQLGRLQSLPKKEREELQKRLPSSLSAAEDKANRMLESYIRKAVPIVGRDTYIKRLKDAMSQQAQTMLAIRCWIAAKTTTGPKNSIQIYRNKAMEAWEFFPESAKESIIDPKTGQSSIFINYETDDDDPYERQEIVKSKRHYEVGRIDEPGPKKIDRLPEQWGDAMEKVLEGYGYQVEDLTHAWKLLDKVSKESSIEDRILSKIAYLITHVTSNNKNKMLPG